MLTLAFDVYGTLIDTQGIQRALGDALHDDELGHALSLRWREKQLEYSFRRGLMEQYVPFSECTHQALRQVLAEAKQPLPEAMVETLMAGYRHLPPFPDASDLLQKLDTLAVRSFAFTNGEAGIATDLLSNASLLGLLEGIVSVEVIRTFKPSPKVYRHFQDITDAPPDNIWLVSGNPFDILGAKAMGWHTAWVQRGNALFDDAWGQHPDVTLSNLAELPAAILR